MLLKPKIKTLLKIWEKDWIDKLGEFFQAKEAGLKCQKSKREDSDKEKLLVQ